MLLSSINRNAPIPVEVTEDFENFLTTLPAYQYQMVAKRIRLLAHGHWGDSHKCWIAGKTNVSIAELRIHSRPGIRAYLSHVDGKPLLLCGGIHNTQRADLQKAARLLQAHLR